MLPFVVIFLVAGFGLVMAGRNLEQRSREAARWPTVPGQLEQCEVVEVPALRLGDLSSWQLRVRYSYVVRGKTHHCTQYAFGYGDGRDDAKHRVVAAGLKSRPELSVYYNPARPSEAVLSTEVQTNITTVGYSTLVVAFVSAIIYWMSCR